MPNDFRLQFFLRVYYRYTVEQLLAPKECEPASCLSQSIFNMRSSSYMLCQPNVEGREMSFPLSCHTLPEMAFAWPTK